MLGADTRHTEQYSFVKLSVEHKNNGDMVNLIRMFALVYQIMYLNQPFCLFPEKYPPSSSQIMLTGRCGFVPLSREFKMLSYLARTLSASSESFSLFRMTLI